jgi:hypothetical protein
MKPPGIMHLLHLALLRCASLLVPASERAEWWREWHSELWHVNHICAPSGGGSNGAEREVTAFCLGAFQDALFLRRQRHSLVRTASTAIRGPAAIAFSFLPPHWRPAMPSR